MKLSPWDFAAGSLLCLEAGATVTDFVGQPFTLNKGQAVVANATLHQRMLAIVSQGKYPP